MFVRPKTTEWSGDIAALADYIILAGNALEVSKRKIYSEQATVCSDAVVALQKDILKAIRTRVSKEAK